MAELIGVLEAAANLDAIFGRFETIVNKFYERRDVAEDNKLLLANIQRKYKLIQKQLPHCQSVVENNMHEYDSLCEMVHELQEELGRVFPMEKDIMSVKKFKRVKRMNQIMTKCEDLEKELLAFLREKASLNPGNCIPPSNIPPNPPRLTLDYTKADTCEGELKGAILGQVGQRIIAFIASGQGGVGKTCALRGLAGDLHIKQRFTGGLLYIQLGNDAKLSDIIDGLAEIVCLTGGKQLSEEIRTQETLQNACKLAAPWFINRTCLFLVDDIWNLNGIDSSTITLLGEIVHGNSRMVYSSRDKYFVSSAERVINFKEKKADGLIARNMLLRHAGFSENEYRLFGEETVSAFNAILQECQGLPLALGIVGGAIIKMSCEYDDGDKTEVWVDYRKDIEKCSTMYGVAKQSNMAADLRRIIDLSLDVLRKRDEKIDFSYLFRALCVLRNQQSVSCSVLQKLWNLDSLDDTDAIVKAFRDVSLVQTTRKQGTRYVQLHDLVLDLAKHEATTNGETQYFYDLFIKNYSRKEEDIVEISDEPSASAMDSEIDVQKHEKDKRHTKWWDVAADDYIHENVCELLHRGEKIDELLWILSQPEWIVFRLLNGGVLQVEADVQVGIAALAQTASSSERQEHLEIIGKAVKLSRSYVYSNPSEVWFQLYGRLQLHAKSNEWTRKFIRSIECVAPRPWVKSPMGVVQQANLSSQGILRSKGVILCIRMAKDIVSVVWKSREEIGVTSWDVNADHEETIMMNMSCQMQNGSDEFRASPIGAAFSADGLHITVVYDSLHVCICERETGTLENCYRLGTRSNTQKKKRSRRFLLPGASRRLRNQEQEGIVAISKNGKYIATSNNAHDVQLWSAANGEKFGGLLQGHRERARCMALSKDESRLVTGSNDGTIRVWDVQSGKPIGGPLLGHTNEVLCLAMSADCTQVVSGARDDSVRIWDIRAGEPVGAPLVGHKDGVTCVRMSEDGRKIVSGSYDNTVIVWDAEKGVIDGQPLHGHSRFIKHVDISGDGDCAVSGSWDFTVRVWNTSRTGGVGKGSDTIENGRRKCLMSADGRRCVIKTEEDVVKVVNTQSGEAVEFPCRIEMESVQCMGISADDWRGVFGMDDGGLIVFDASTGKKIGNSLYGHEMDVLCVAIGADGKVIVSGSRDRTLRIWDTESGECIGKPLAGHSSSVFCVALSSDGSRVVSGSKDKTVRVWDARSGEAVGGPLIGHSNWIYCVGLSADGSTVVSGSSDCTVRVWDVHSSQQIGGPFDGLGRWMCCLGFNENISKIATIFHNGTLKLWDVESGSCVLTSSGHHCNSELNRLSLSSDGNFDLVRRKQIIDFDENGRKIVLATTDVDVFNVPGRDVYFSRYSDLLKVVR